MSLKKEEIERITELFVSGPALLYEQGMNFAQVKAFLLREDVRAYMEVLRAEAMEQPALMERTKFSINRKMRRTAPLLMDILERALKGDEYLTDPATGQQVKDGDDKPVLIREAPTQAQVVVAQDLLNRLGIIANRDFDPLLDAGTGKVFDRAIVPIEIVYEPGTSEADKTLSRERVRSIISLLSDQLPRIVKEANRTAKLPLTTRPSRSKKKPTARLNYKSHAKIKIKKH